MNVQITQLHQFLTVILTSYKLSIRVATTPDKHLKEIYLLGVFSGIIWVYSTGRSQHNTDFAKTNQNEVMRICTNFFEYFWIHKLIRENEFVILNL